MSAVKNLSIRLSAVGGDKVRQEFKNLGNDGDKAFRRITQVITPANDNLKALDATARSFNEVIRQGTALFGAYLGFQGLKNTFSSIFSANTTFERLSASLKTVTGSTKAAQEAFTLIEKFAINTPYQLNEIVEAFIRLKALSQISNLEQRVAEKITLAETQANLAKYYAEAAMPAPLGSKISVPANTKVPDGYEPVWYKNTITRQRYPDFFKQLVDTNYLIYVDETTYDEQVSQYGMCSSYVKLDENTLILPLLTNYARSGTPDSLGKILNDQFQGHWHEVVYRQDSISSGYRADIFGNDGLTGSPSNTSGSDEYMQYVGSRARDWLCAINPISDTVILMNIMYSLNVALMEIGKNGIVCLFWLMKAMLLN